MKVKMSYVNDNTYSVENSTKNNILIDMCDPNKKKTSLSNGIDTFCSN